MQCLKNENLKLNSALYAHMLAIHLWMLAFDEARMLVLEIRDADMWSMEVMASVGRALIVPSHEREATLTAPKQRFLTELIRVAEHAEVSEDFGRSLINASMNLDMLVPLEKVLPKLPRESTAMYTAVMKVYATLGKPDSVMEVWNELTQVKHITPSQVCLGQALNALASHNCPARARALLQEWRSQVQPNCVMYTTVIKGLGRAKDFDGAKQVWKEMLEDGVEANVKAYNTLLDACARAGRMDTDGAEILAEMEQNKIPVVSVTVSTAVKGFCHRGMLSQAAAKLGKSSTGRTHGGGEEASAYNAMLDGCVKAGDFARFDETYAEMQRKAVRVTSFTLTAIVKRYGNAGHIDKAYSCVETLCEKYGNSLLNVHVATCLISASFRNRVPERAIEFFKSMPARGLQPDSITYATVISGTKAMGGSANRALATAVGLAEDALCGPGLPTHAVEELVNRLRGNHALGTHGQSLVTNLKKRNVEVPKYLLSAVARAAVSQ
jgi:pentatricopeptide repeat protein